MYAIQRNVKEIKMQVCEQPVGRAANTRESEAGRFPSPTRARGNRVSVARGRAGYALGSDPTTLTNDTDSPGAPPRLCAERELAAAGDAGDLVRARLAAELIPALCPSGSTPSPSATAPGGAGTRAGLSPLPPAGPGSSSPVSG